MNACKLVMAVAVVGLIGAGCGRKATPPPSQTASVPLPEWAPKNPSPEFLRAAQVLKPIPPEILSRLDEVSLARDTRLARYSGTLTPAWEFFGMLSDQQVEQFRSAREIRVPIKSATRRQRAALDMYFRAWREAMAGQQQLPQDLLVSLYKDGAKEDLSNVDAGFVSDGRGVNLQFWITRPDGSMSTPSNTVATM